MRDLLQFVDGISAAPSVLLDLNNDSPIYLARDGWSAPPPRLNRAVSSSSARDGAQVSQSAYTDRELVITVGLNTTSQDEAAEAIQALGRLLNSEGQWLMYQTTIEPVFFRTKRAEIDGLAEFNGQADGFREVTLRIPAEPFAYGLPVTDTATITNDPTAATNPMSLAVAAVQGDVATPVRVDIAWPSTVAPLRRMIVGSLAVDSLLNTFQHVSATAIPLTDPGTRVVASAGWTVADQTNTDMVNGKARRFTYSSGSLDQRIIGAVVDTKPGDYRVLLRARRVSSVGSQPWTFIAAGKKTKVASLPVSVGWVDLGVCRLPATPPLSDLSSPPPVAAFLEIAAAPGVAGAEFDLDDVLLVPAGLDSQHGSALAAILAPTVAVGAVQNVVVDGLGSTAYGYKMPEDFWQFVVTGGLPTLVPGVENLLVLVLGNAKTLTFDVTFMYYPRYLYIRPATS